MEQIRKIDSYASFGPLRIPRPRPKYIPAPPFYLPAFERIKKLLEGSMQRRGGKVIKKDEDGVVEELFQTLLKEGWLDHLRKEG